MTANWKIAMANKTDTVTKVYYGLLVKKTGKLAGIMADLNDGADFCGEYTYTLTTTGSGREYLVEDKDLIYKTLYAPVEWYNSSDERPCLGHFKPDDFEVVKVHRTQWIEPVNTDDKPVAFKHVYVYDLDNSSNALGYLCLMPKNETIESLKRFIGQRVVFAASSQLYTLVDVMPTPKELVNYHYLDGKEGVVLIVDNIF